MNHKFSERFVEVPKDQPTTIFLTARILLESNSPRQKFRSIILLGIFVSSNWKLNGPHYSYTLLGLVCAWTGQPAQTNLRLARYLHCLSVDSKHRHIVFRSYRVNLNIYKFDPRARCYNWASDLNDDDPTHLNMTWIKLSFSILSPPGSLICFHCT